MWFRVHFKQVSISPPIGNISFETVVSFNRNCLSLTGSWLSLSHVLLSCRMVVAMPCRQMKFFRPAVRKQPNLMSFVTYHPDQCQSFLFYQSCRYTFSQYLMQPLTSKDNKVHTWLGKWCGRFLHIFFSAEKNHIPRPVHTQHIFWWERVGLYPFAHKEGGTTNRAN